MNDNETSPLDIYLTEPCSVNISDMAKDLVDKYGRFWISHEGQLKYRTTNNTDITVNDISIGNYVGNKLIVCVNGIIVPTMSLEQLRILLNCCERVGYKVYSDLLYKINSYRSILNRTLF